MKPSRWQHHAIDRTGKIKGIRSYSLSWKDIILYTTTKVQIAAEPKVQGVKTTRAQKSGLRFYCGRSWIRRTTVSQNTSPW